MRKWPEPLVAAIRAELQGNARRDLIGWAHRTVDAKATKKPVSAHDLERARLVLVLASESRNGQPT
jgi:hypothetical protein